MLLHNGYIWRLEERTGSAQLMWPIEAWLYMRCASKEQGDHSHGKIWWLPFHDL
jgi:hypothetical protein